DEVRFRTKGNGTEAVSPVEFLRRFAQHVLPVGFHKIRHVGLNASAQKREQARIHLNLAPAVLQLCSWRERLIALTGHDVSVCPQCASPMITLVVARARDPPEMAA